MDRDISNISLDSVRRISHAMHVTLSAETKFKWVTKSRFEELFSGDSSLMCISICDTCEYVACQEGITKIIRVITIQTPDGCLFSRKISNLPESLRMIFLNIIQFCDNTEQNTLFYDAIVDEICRHFADAGN